MIKAIFFDLDRCVFDTTKAVRDTRERLIQIFGRMDKNRQFDLDKIKEEIWNTPVYKVFRKHKVPRSLSERFFSAYYQVISSVMIRPFPDVSMIDDLDVKRFLVTTGRMDVQLGKVDRLGVAELFHEIYVDTDDNPGDCSGKRRIFEALLKKYDLSPREVLVIGDNPESELKAGKEIGAYTVQSLRPSIIKASGFDFYVKSFDELPAIIEKLNSL